MQTLAQRSRAFSAWMMTENKQLLSGERLNDRSPFDRGVELLREVRANTDEILDAESLLDQGRLEALRRTSSRQLWVLAGGGLSIVATTISLVIIFIPIAAWIQYTTLAVLSLVKFLAVIFYFMHLRWDKPFCTILFFIGLILGGGTAGALLLLFSEDRSTNNPEPEPAAVPLTISARTSAASLWIGSGDMMVKTPSR